MADDQNKNQDTRTEDMEEFTENPSEDIKGGEAGATSEDFTMDELGADLEDLDVNDDRI